MNAQSAARVALLSVWCVLIVVFVSVAASAAPPRAYIDSPSSGQTLYLTTTLTVTGRAENATGVSVCLVGGANATCHTLLSVTSWSVEFDLRPLAEGQYTITACPLNGNGTGCAMIGLSLVRTDLRVLSFSNQYFQPFFAGLGVISGVATLISPRWYRRAEKMGTLLAALAVVAIGLQLYFGTFSFPLAVGAVLVVVMIGAHYRPKWRNRNLEVD